VIEEIVEDFVKHALPTKCFFEMELLLKKFGEHVTDEFINLLEANRLPFQHSHLNPPDHSHHK